MGCDILFSDRGRKSKVLLYNAIPEDPEVGF
jgi:hypothetical protein